APWVRSPSSPQVLVTLVVMRWSVVGSTSSSARPPERARSTTRRGVLAAGAALTAREAFDAVAIVLAGIADVAVVLAVGGLATFFAAALFAAAALFSAAFFSSAFFSAAFFSAAA